MGIGTKWKRYLVLAVVCLATMGLYVAAQFLQYRSKAPHGAGDAAFWNQYLFWFVVPCFFQMVFFLELRWFLAAYKTVRRKFLYAFVASHILGAWTFFIALFGAVRRYGG
jgi:hypothetical protein